ncbi:MAG: DUF3987 domain-containing protein [Ignavibacteria bacterium]|nr:DUF3987 domain-containing protein [Ignavibacteria bacterium]
MNKHPKTKITQAGLSNDLHKLTSVEDEFPISVFPETLQKVALDYSRATGAPMSFLGGSMLTIAGVSLGNSARLSFGNYSANGVIFLCIVGRRGTGKTHPIDFILKPLQELDRKKWREYKQTVNDWKQHLIDNPKSKDPEPMQPKMSITSDCTPEALVSLHETNPKSLLIFRDELSGLVQSFDQYNKGAESQKYLQLWNGSAISVSRKGSGMTRIDSPHVSIIGGVQPEILPILAEKSRISSGFLDRILFCYPESCIAQPDTSEVVNSYSWCECISKIYEIPPFQDAITGEISPLPIRLSKEAQVILSEYNEILRAMINSTIHDLEDPTGGIAAKLRIYLYRFALILQALSYGCGESHQFSEVDAESARGAVLLAMYFLNTALKVHANLSDRAKKAFNIRRVHKLSEHGRTVREIAKIMELSVGTVSNYSKQIP